MLASAQISAEKISLSCQHSHCIVVVTHRVAPNYSLPDRWCLIAIGRRFRGRRHARRHAAALRRAHVHKCRVTEALHDMLYRTSVRSGEGVRRLPVMQCRNSTSLPIRTNDHILSGCDEVCSWPVRKVLAFACAAAHKTLDLVIQTWNATNLSLAYSHHEFGVLRRTLGTWQHVAGRS